MTWRRTGVLGGAAVAAAAGVAWYLWSSPRAAAEDEEEDDDEVLEAGMLLLEHAQEERALMPVAFLVNAIIKNADGTEDANTRIFARLIEALEVLVLYSEDPPEDVLQRVANILEESERRVRGMLAETPPYADLCAELQDCVDKLRIDEEAVMSTAKDLDLRCFSRAVFDERPNPPPPEPADLQMHSLIEEKRRIQAADEEQARLLAARNQLLQEQVAQMQKVLSQPQPQQRMSAREFFNYFPMPPDEPERRLHMSDSGLDTLRAPLPMLDAALKTLATSGQLGTSLCGLMVTLMGADTQRVLALLCRSPEGSFVDGQECGVPQWPVIPRKLTRCQYVVASGDVVCVNRESGNLMPDAERSNLMPTMAEADHTIAEACAPGGYVSMIQEHIASVKAGGEANQNLSIALESFGGNKHYLGAPIKIEHRVVGAMCAWFTDAAAIKVAGRKEMLEEQAAVAGKLLGGARAL